MITYASTCVCGYESSLNVAENLITTQFVKCSFIISEAKREGQILRAKRFLLSAMGKAGKFLTSQMFNAKAIFQINDRNGR